jgi:hypothetical protein
MAKKRHWIQYLSLYKTKGIVFKVNQAGKKLVLVYYLIKAKDYRLKIPKNR